MKTLETCKIEIIGGQIMSRISAKGTNSTETRTVKVVVPKSITSDGALDINEMPEEEVVENLDKKRMTEVGDLVIKLSTPYGAGIVDEDTAGCIVPSFCAIIKSTGELDSKYLLAFLNSDLCKEQISSQVSRAAMTVISVGKVKNLLIPIPDDTKQAEIGNNFVETKKKLQIMRRIAALEEEKNNIIFEELANDKE